MEDDGADVEGVLEVIYCTILLTTAILLTSLEDTVVGDDAEVAVFSPLSSVSPSPAALVNDKTVLVASLESVLPFLTLFNADDDPAEESVTAAPGGGPVVTSDT